MLIEVINKHNWNENTLDLLITCQPNLNIRIIMNQINPNETTINDSTMQELQ